MMKKLIPLFIALSLLAGCVEKIKQPDKPPLVESKVQFVNDPTQKVDKVQVAATQASGRIIDSSKEVVKETKKIDQRTSDPEVLASTDKIRNLETEIQNQARTIADQKAELDSIKKDISTLKDIIVKKDAEFESFKRASADAIKNAIDEATKPLIDENKKLKDKLEVSTSGWSWMLGLIAVGSIGLLIVGGILTVLLRGQGLPVGLAVMVGGGIGIVSSIAILNQSIAIGIAGVSVLVLVVGSAIIKALITERRAVKEAVHTTEVTKQALKEVAPDKATEIFGDGITPKIAYNIQSESTEKIVKAERDALLKK